MDSKVLDTEIFPQHANAYLNSGITFHCFLESRKVFAVKGNKHIHTLARKLILFNDKQTWIKRKSRLNNIKMGVYNGGKICE